MIQSLDSTTIVDTVLKVTSVDLTELTGFESDTTIVTGKITIADTLSVIDTGNYFTHPAFWVSVIVPLIAILLPTIRARYREKRQLKRLKSYAEYLTTSLLSSFQLRARVFGKLSCQLRDINTRERHYLGSLGNNAKHLLSLSPDELFRAFLGDKTKVTDDDKMHYKNILDAVEYYDNHDEYGKRNFKQFMADTRRYETTITENLDKILRMFDRWVSMGRQQGVRPSDDPFLKGADRIIAKWQKNEDYSLLTVMNSEILIPLKPHCKTYTTDPRAMDTLELIIKCSMAYMNLETAHKVYQNAFLQTAVTLVKKKRELIAGLAHFFPEKKAKDTGKTRNQL